MCILMASAVISWIQWKDLSVSFYICLAVSHLLSLSTLLLQSGSLSVPVFALEILSMAFTFHWSTSAVTHVNNKEHLSLMATTTGPGLSDCECHMVN